MIAFEQLLQSTISPPPFPPPVSSSNIIISTNETNVDGRNFFSANYHYQQTQQFRLLVGEYHPFVSYSQYGSDYNGTNFAQNYNFTLTFDDAEDSLVPTTSPSSISLTADFPRWWALSAFVLVFGTAAGNVLVCLAIYWERRLQNVTNYFLMSLAITDLMVAILVMPMGILALVQGNYVTYSFPFLFITFTYSKIITFIINAFI